MYQKPSYGLGKIGQENDLQGYLTSLLEKQTNDLLNLQSSVTL